MRIVFSGRYQTQLFFHVKKKVALKTLRDLGAEAVAELIKDENMIERLEVPETLVETIQGGFEDDWSERRYLEYVEDGDIIDKILNGVITIENVIRKGIETVSFVFEKLFPV